MSWKKLNNEINVGCVSMKQVEVMEKLNNEINVGCVSMKQVEVMEKTYLKEVDLVIFCCVFSKFILDL